MCCNRFDQSSPDARCTCTDALLFRRPRCKQVCRDGLQTRGRAGAGRTIRDQTHCLHTSEERNGEVQFGTYLLRLIIRRVPPCHGDAHMQAGIKEHMHKCMLSAAVTATCQCGRHAVLQFLASHTPTCVPIVRISIVSRPNWHPFFIPMDAVQRSICRTEALQTRRGHSLSASDTQYHKPWYQNCAGMFAGHWSVSALVIRGSIQDVRTQDQAAARKLARGRSCSGAGAQWVLGARRPRAENPMFIDPSSSISRQSSSQSDHSLTHVCHPPLPTTQVQIQTAGSQL